MLPSNYSKTKSIDINELTSKENYDMFLFTNCTIHKQEDQHMEGGYSVEIQQDDELSEKSLLH